MSKLAAPWSTPGRAEWVREVHAWVTESLTGLGEAPDSFESVKERPWGAVLRVVTSSSTTFFFKAMGPSGRHESLLLADIAERRPDLAPDVLAVDHALGWALMPDHGDAMTALPAREQVTLIESLLGPYAEMQRTTVDLVTRWIDAGVPDRSPQRLPGLLEELLAGPAPHRPLPIGAAERHAYLHAIDAFTEVCDELARSAAPTAIDHADIHGTNVLVGDTHPWLIDWGDSCIAHPYSSLLVPIEWVVRLVPAPERPDAVARLRDAYLEPWGDRTDGQTAALATWVSYVARAVSNADQSLGGSDDDIADAQREIVALLRTWYAKRTLLGRPTELLLPRMPG